MYLLRSHTLQCPAALTFCPIKGCGAHLRRGDVEKHVEANQPGHYPLLKEDRNDILWRVKEMVSLRIKLRLASLEETFNSIIYSYRIDHDWISEI